LPNSLFTICAMLLYMAETPQSIPTHPAAIFMPGAPEKSAMESRRNNTASVRNTTWVARLCLSVPMNMKAVKTAQIRR